MGSITSPGIGSGLDVNSIVSQLLAIEQRPLLALDQDEAGYQAQISSIGSLKSSLSTLQTSFTSLADGTVFDEFSATTTDDTVATATAGSTAVAGQFDLTVTRLAQRHKSASNEFASTATFGGTAGDKLTLTVDTTSFELDLSSAQTLAQIRDTINGSGNTTGVTANIISGNGSNETLVLTAQDSGFDKRIQLSYAGTINSTTLGFSTINTDKNGVTIATDAELDASLTVDGVALTRASNSITDVVSGVNLSLIKDGTTSIEVARNDGAVTGTVNTLVTNFNSVLGELTAQAASGTNGSLVRSVEAQLRGLFNHSVAGLGSFSSLAQLGVSTSETGQLTLDTTVLQDALSSDRAGVKKLFSDTTNGIATQFDSVIEGLVQTNGVLDSMVDGINSQISLLQSRRESLQFRLESTETRLRAQFTALDGLVSNLTTTSNFLSTQLSSLANIRLQNN